MITCIISPPRVSCFRGGRFPARCNSFLQSHCVILFLNQLLNEMSGEKSFTCISSYIGSIHMFCFLKTKGFFNGKKVSTFSPVEDKRDQNDQNVTPKQVSPHPHPTFLTAKRGICASHKGLSDASSHYT
jgi:hypothetical protein